MADEGGGICALCCFGAFQNYCDTKAYGSGSGTQQAGCFPKCCDDSFNKDPFDGPLPPTQTAQPGATTEMTVPTLAIEETAPPYVAVPAVTEHEPTPQPAETAVTEHPAPVTENVS
ncbi:hypothetical protein FIBSPDRAFT_851598 [Athelia psychrophila]|uniref:Uncharacterized protein n=1 Tax=Athelia psychrophila TaxID=1759441 RepID=A0A166SAW0_9AGAM|nr:hypothetical protein FIBSPDRAFT_851598 [Fibularhizoctonia sp. CBS 109695]